MALIIFMFVVNIGLFVLIHRFIESNKLNDELKTTAGLAIVVSLFSFFGTALIVVFGVYVLFQESSVKSFFDGKRE